MKHLTLFAVAVVASLTWLVQPARAELPSWCNDPVGHTLKFESAALADAKSGDLAGKSDARIDFYGQQVQDSNTAAGMRAECAAAETSGATRTWNLLLEVMDLTSISAARHKMAELLNVEGASGGDRAEYYFASARSAQDSEKANRSGAKEILKQITRTYGSDQIKVYNGLHYLLVGS